ncbi:MAG: GAF domain-containing protein [Candidatus Neomarinimicrobiota bacterium]
MNNFYSDLSKQVHSLINDEKNIIANMANISALLFENISNINWVGFYRLIDNQLVIGPFQGKTVCIRIAIGKGVCGTCVKIKETIIVDNVHNFKGHITCDSESKSEIVIPLFNKTEIIGVLDIDSPIYNRFDNEDKIGLENIVKILTENIN